MPFTKANAAELGRKGGRSTAGKYGTEHMRAIGREGFAALARKLGYVGGSRRVALMKLVSKGRIADRGPDQSEAIGWADRVLDGLAPNPDDVEIPY